MAPTTVVAAFNAAINRRDVDGLAHLMTDDHEFVDTGGAVLSGRSRCLEAWRGFFSSFPDYRNVFDSLVADGDVVTALGRSECTEPSLRGPALWTATVRDGRVARWQVHEDTAETRQELALPPA